MNQNSKPQLNYQCHEPFWRIQKNNGVDFCKTCNHEIIDFTNMNTEQITKLLKEQTGKACGKYYEDQIVINEKTKQGPSLSKILLASAISTITILTSTAQTINKDAVKTEQTPRTNSNNQNIDNNQSLPKVECYQVPEEETAKTIQLKKHSKYGKYYLSWKFPFVHKKRRRVTMGYF